MFDITMTIKQSSPVQICLIVPLLKLKIPFIDMLLRKFHKRFHNSGQTSRGRVSNVSQRTVCENQRCITWYVKQNCECDLKKKLLEFSKSF